MYLSVLLLNAYCGLAAAAGPHGWMYGVPNAPDLDMNEVMIEGDVDLLVAAATEAATTATNTTQSSNSTTPGSSGQEPCATISKMIAAAPAGARKVVAAELGMSCLASIPLDMVGNVKLIDELMLFTKWQSNSAYLKSPPAEYTEKPVDIMGELVSMQKKLTSGGFANEYEFQLKMMTLFNSAYDNHFAYQPDILATAVQFQRPPGTELVSVSADGSALPEIYTYKDVQLANRDPSFKPSAVKMINGMSAQNFLSEDSAKSDFHDADTRWNALFPSQPLIAQGLTFLGSFRSGEYQGPNTTMEFANGTTFAMMNVAVIIGNFTGVDSGKTFFKKFCTGPQPIVQTTAGAPTPTNNNTTKATPSPKPSHIGYPKAEIIIDNLSVGGYFINGTEYKDVAVLSIPSYEAGNVQAFQNVMRDFIRQCKATGKTKMIFDMRGNGGGNAIMGYDTFKQVYPQAEKEPFGGTRFRVNDALNLAGKVTQDLVANKTYAQGNATAFAEAFGQTTQEDVLFFTTGFNFQHNLDVQNEAFSSWEQMFGPQQANGDMFTSTLRYNFSDSISTTYTGFSVVGFLDNTNETATPQPFQAEDMVMLHDGMCSSTCAIAAELLKNQGAVRTIAIGGRPQEGPMQGVGGTKGAQVFSWGDIQSHLQAIYFLGSPAQQSQWDTQDLGKTAFATQLFKRSATNAGRVAGGVNLKDNLRQNDASGTPLEFMYEAADCRMWFTAPMISDVTQVWKGVADRMFNGAEGMGKCVKGSTGDKTSVSGGGQFRNGDGSAGTGKNGTGTAAATGSKSSAVASQSMILDAAMATGSSVPVMTTGAVDGRVVASWGWVGLVGGAILVLL